MRAACLVLLLVVAVSAGGASASVIRSQERQLEYAFATTENGDVRGLVLTSRNGTLYKRFAGIPYATPPTGDLRFKAPLPAANWSGVRDALTFGESCPQSSSGSEDCLYINVYVPETNDASPLPVMAYIYGGGFTTGTSTGKTPDNFVENGVLLVTLNYRLGPLGFLSLQNDDIPGNAGLKDQVLALQWVQRNIAAFGGDPSRVVIFGQSAGGGSTSHLFLSPAAKGLFSGAVMESGVATGSWALTGQSRERAYRMAEALGFQPQGDANTDVDDARLAAFLRAANYSDLNNAKLLALSDFEKRCPVPLEFVPVIEPPSDSAVIVEHPVEVLRAGSYNQVPIIVGVTSGEGALVSINSSIMTDSGIADMKENFTLLIGSQLPLPTEEQRTRAAQQLERFYFGDEGFSADDMQAVTDLFSDLYFIQPADYFARAVVNSSSLPVHFYYFDYNGTGNTDYGMNHAATTLYLFAEPDMNSNTNDGRVADQLTTLWTSFVKYGDPAPSGNPVAWDTFKENASNYLDMELEFVTRQDLLKERMDFWREILSQ